MNRRQTCLNFVKSVTRFSSQAGEKDVSALDLFPLDQHQLVSTWNIRKQLEKDYKKSNSQIVHYTCSSTLMMKICLFQHLYGTAYFWWAPSYKVKKHTTRIVIIQVLQLPIFAICFAGSQITKLQAFLSVVIIVTHHICQIIYLATFSKRKNFAEIVKYTKIPNLRQPSVNAWKWFQTNENFLFAQFIPYKPT